MARTRLLHCWRFGFFCAFFTTHAHTIIPCLPVRLPSILPSSFSIIHFFFLLVVLDMDAGTTFCLYRCAGLAVGMKDALNLRLPERVWSGVSRWNMGWFCAIPSCGRFLALCRVVFLHLPERHWCRRGGRLHPALHSVLQVDGIVPGAYAV